MIEVEIKAVIETSLIDWPGKLATVVFLPGCNLRCRYCHARELVAGGAGLGTIPVSEVLSSIRAREGWIDGVVISGGEPTLHRGLADLAAEIRSAGLQVRLDTNGTRPDVLSDLLKNRLLDSIAMDVKAPLDGSYAQVAQCDVDLGALRKSIRIIRDSGLEHEFRTTVLPSYTRADIARIAEAIGRGAARSSGAKARSRYVLQPFNPHSCLDSTFESLPPTSPAFLEEAVEEARKFLDDVTVRGR